MTRTEFGLFSASRPYKGYDIEVRHQKIFYMGFILDKNKNTLARTPFRMSRQEAMETAIELIDKGVET